MADDRVLCLSRCPCASASVHGWAMPGVEQQFLRFDQQLYGFGLAKLVALTPWPLLDVLEFAYLSTFIFVPGGMLILTLTGQAASADRFWTLVLAGEFGSFGVLPWI